jgi:hypothetical protein
MFFYQIWPATGDHAAMCTTHKHLTTVQQNKFVTVNENTVKQLNTGFPSAKQGQ